MKNIVWSCRVMAIFSAMALAGFGYRAQAQGGLTPAGAPGPLMKSLDQIEARTPITSLPFPITSSGSYYLTTNLTGTSGADGILITAPDVTVDLNGFTLIGVPGSKSGIALFGARATIKNGNIRNWGTNGIAGIGNLNTVIKSVIVSSNGAGGLDGGSHGLVEFCIAEANVVDGISAGPGTTVRDCSANRNGHFGISCYTVGGSPFSSGCIITGCTASQNNTGISASGNSLVSGNNLLNNTFAGVAFANQGGRVENNNFANNFNGVYTPGLTNLVIRNSFINSSNAPIFGISSALPIGPLIPASGVATNLNPNANFSY